MGKVAFYVNDGTGELSPPHRIGTDREGRALYQRADGFSPAGAGGRPLECESNADGNWVEPSEG